MNSVLNVTVSQYIGFKNGHNQGYRRIEDINLLDFLIGNAQADIIKEIRATQNNDLKIKLKAVTVSGLFDGRRLITAPHTHTWLLCLDFDEFKTVTQEELEQFLVAQPYIAFVGKSVRGKVFAIAHIHPEQHQAAFSSFQVLFTAFGTPIDKACRDVTRLRFASLQENPYINHKPLPYVVEDLFLQEQVKATKKEKAPKKELNKAIDTTITIDEATARREIISCISWINNARKVGGVRSTLDYIPGERTGFTTTLAGMLNAKGIPLETALLILVRMLDMDEHYQNVVRDIYTRYAGEYGTNILPPTPPPPQANKQPPTPTKVALSDDDDYQEYKGEYRDSDIKFHNVIHYLFSNYVLEHNTIKNEILLNGRPSNKEKLAYLILGRGFTGIKDYITPILSSPYVKKVNPIKDFFLTQQHIPIERDYIAELCSYIKTDNKNFEVHLKKHLVRSIECLLGTNANKHCLTFYGKTNNGKTKLIKWILSPFWGYFEDMRSKISGDNDQFSSICENIGILLDELDKYPKRDIDEFKALFTRSFFRRRPLYGTTKVDAKRIASFWATTNERELLTDTTGNVRWLIFNILSINHDEGGKNGYCALDPKMLWLQAYKLWKEGYNGNLTPEEIQESEANNQGYKANSIELELVANYFTPGKKGDAFLSATDVMRWINEQEAPHIRLTNINTIGKALSSLGYERSQKNSKYGYYCTYNKAADEYDETTPVIPNVAETIEEKMKKAWNEKKHTDVGTSMC